MNYTVKNKYKEDGEEEVFKNYYFKINKSKLFYNDIFYRQLRLVVKRIKERDNVINITISTGTVKDDFIKNKCTLLIEAQINKTL